MRFHERWPVVFALALLVVAVLAAGPSRPRVAPGTTSILGSGRGLDHVIVIVRDLESATRTYTEMLGLTVGKGGDFPGGLRSRAIRFASNYVELMTMDTTEAPPGDELVQLLRQREGGYAFSLNVSSAQQTADSLRARRFEVVGPVSAPVLAEGSKEVGPAPWRTVAITSPALPYEPLFFIQYIGAVTRPAPAAHACTAVDLRAVWIAVKDLETATRGYRALGLSVERERRLPRLSAMGREIGAGQGVILLLQPTGAQGPLASYLARYGEGVVGMSIEVRDLQSARSLLRRSTGQEAGSYRGLYGTSVTVPPRFTHGVWIEFFQR